MGLFKVAFALPFALTRWVNDGWRDSLKEFAQGHDCSRPAFWVRLEKFLGH